MDSPKCPACRQTLIDPQVCFFCGDTVRQLQREKFSGKVAFWCLIAVVVIVIAAIIRSKLVGG